MDPTRQLNEQSVDSLESTKQTDNNTSPEIPGDPYLQKILDEREKAIKEELRQLREMKKVKMNDDIWPLIAVNVREKEVALIENEAKSSQVISDLSSENSKSYGVVGWKGLIGETKARKTLKSMQRLELEELKNRKLVLKSLLHPSNKFEESAHLFFSRKDRPISRRTGTCIVVGQVDDMELVMKQTESLMGAVFSKPSSKHKLHNELLKRARREQRKKRTSQIEMQQKLDLESSSGDTRENTKKLKKKRKPHVAPYTSIKQFSGRVSKASNNRIQLSHAPRLLNKLKCTDEHDTLEEVSETESVSSISTIRNLTSPSSARRTEVSPLSTSQKKEALSSLRIVTDGISTDEVPKKLDTSTSGQLQGVKVQQVSSVRSSQLEHDTIMLDRMDSTSSQSSANDYSLSGSFSSTMNSSIKSTDDDIDDEDITTSLNFYDAEIPNLPPADFGASTDKTSSWLDRYPPLPSTAATTSDTSEDDFNFTSPQISEESFAADPGITPFIATEINPFSDCYSAINPKWKGNLVQPKAWADPDFREYSNNLDHEPTHDDVVVYKMVGYSELIEEKYANKLDDFIKEAFLLAFKEQLSFKSFRNLCQKFALQVDSIRERTVLMALLGRNLWERLPNFQEQILHFTQQTVQEYFMLSNILDADMPADSSEIRSDYEDWGCLHLSDDQVQRTVLMENAPFMVSTDSLSSSSSPMVTEGRLPPYPPDPILYKQYLSLPRSRIKRSISVEVLFRVEPANENGSPSIQTNSMVNPVLPKNPLTRTVSENSIYETDSRKSSMGPVFEQIPEFDDQNNMVENNNNIIAVDDKHEAWKHLKNVEHGITNTLSRPVVISTQNSSGGLSRSSSRSSSRQDSITSISSVSSGTMEGRNGSITPVKTTRKISGMSVSPVFEKIHEEFVIEGGITHTEHGTIEEIKYTHITMIKPHPSNTSHDSESPDMSPDEEEDKDKPDFGTERRRSSSEVFTDVAAPVLILGLPALAALVNALK